ncbi:MAG: hypothetical protein WC082_09530 [Victivallales bacterium]
MKAMLIAVIFAVVCGGVSAETKEQQLNKQIAILESKIFALETKNKNLKAELEKKNNPQKIETQPIVKKENKIQKTADEIQQEKNKIYIEEYKNKTKKIETQIKQKEKDMERYKRTTFKGRKQREEMKKRLEEIKKLKVQYNIMSENIKSMENLQENG